MTTQQKINAMKFRVDWWFKEIERKLKEARK